VLKFNNTILERSKYLIETLLTYNVTR